MARPRPASKKRSAAKPSGEGRPGPAKKAKTTQRPDKGKAKAFIDVPSTQALADDDDDDDDDDGRMSVDSELSIDHGTAFARGLDRKGITRSRHELLKEHRKVKPANKDPSKTLASLPKIASESGSLRRKGEGAGQEEDGERLDELDEDDFALMSDASDINLDELSDMLNAASDDDDSDLKFDSSLDTAEDELDGDESDLERDYEARRKLHKSKSSKVRFSGIAETKLPIRLPDGTLQRFPQDGVKASRAILQPATASEDEEDDVDEIEENEAQKRPIPKTDPYGTRHGRTPLLILLKLATKRERFVACRNEISDLSQQIIEDPELSLPTLKRLMGLANPTLKIDTVSGGFKKHKIEEGIRALALLSLLAIFLDIIPGYRIRTLSEVEQDTQVSQQVSRQRDFETGLVSTYRRFLSICENEITSNNLTLSPIAFRCLCCLLKEKNHFNFNLNIMEVVVRKLGRREWDTSSQECHEALTSCLQSDSSGELSLQVVRLISRTIKAHQFVVRPELLSLLLSLRLKDELSHTIRASTEKIYGRDRQSQSTFQVKGKLPWKDRNVDSKKQQQQQQQAVVVSRKARKVMKDRREIEGEIREAEESVTNEEREMNQTQTLKLVFALYFRIVKSYQPSKSTLLPAALEGLSRFAHLVNVDFFKDLLQVLRFIIRDDHVESDQGHRESDVLFQSSRFTGSRIRIKLLCVVTAFQLLSGQGEALNIDLVDFVNVLYALLIPLSLSSSTEDVPHASQLTKEGGKKGSTQQIQTEADLLFQALNSTFLSSRIPSSPTRSLAFAKRLLTCCLNWPPLTILRTLHFFKRLLVKVPELEVLLSTEDRKSDGVWKGDVDDPSLDKSQGAVAWELIGSLQHHWNSSVRSEAIKLASWTKEDS